MLQHCAVQDGARAAVLIVWRNQGCRLLGHHFGHTDGRGVGRIALSLFPTGLCDLAGRGRFRRIPRQADPAGRCRYHRIGPLLLCPRTRAVTGKARLGPPLFPLLQSTGKGGARAFPFCHWSRP